MHHVLSPKHLKTPRMAVTYKNALQNSSVFTHQQREISQGVRWNDRIFHSHVV